MLQQEFRISPRIHPFHADCADSLSVLAYRSLAVTPPTESDLLQLVQTSQRRNKAYNLTGVLLYDRGIYFQWLEGPQDSLNAVWRSIQRDPRHRNVTVLRDEPITDRVFEGWELQFAHGQQFRVDAAIEAMRDSNERLVRTLGKRSPIINLSLTEVFLTHVVPQLVELHDAGARWASMRSSTVAIWHAKVGTVERLARLLIASKASDTTRYIDSLLDQGADFNALYQEVFEPAQLQLGRLWDAEVCDDFQLTIGLTRLQLELRRINATLRSDHICRSDHSVLLSAQPDESHGMSLAMASEVFGRDGWDVTCESTADDESLGNVVQQQWFDVLKVSQSGAVRRDARLAALRNTIDLARAASLNPALIVMVDGRTFIERPHMARAVHADATSGSALESVRIATRLLQANRTLALNFQSTPA